MMRNWQRGLLLSAALLFVVLGFSLATYIRSHEQSPKPEDSVAIAATNDKEPAKPETVNFTIANDGQPITEDQAVKIAGALLGVDPAARHMAKLGKVTDKTVPFVKVIDLPVWKITFTNLAVTFPGAAQPKPEFSTLTCLLDAQTGALLKVSSPLPAAGAVFNETHPEELAEEMKRRPFTHIEASRLADAGVKPLIPLLQELGKQHKTTIPPAKQLVAYLGLYTGNLWTTNFAEHPFWIVNTGGLKTTRGSDALFYVDAVTGKVIVRRLLALPGEGDFGIPHPH